MFCRRHGLFIALGATVIVMVPPVQAMTFRVRSTAVLSRQPTYKTSDRVDFDPAELLVVGLALEQSEGFCRYQLRNQQGKPISTQTAWTLCYNIDRLVLP